MVNNMSRLFKTAMPPRRDKERKMTEKELEKYKRANWVRFGVFRDITDTTITAQIHIQADIAYQATLANELAVEKNKHLEAIVGHLADINGNLLEMRG